MDQVNELTQIVDADLSFLGKELAKTKTPVKQEELVIKTAFKKTASLRHLEAKKYHPDCVYEIGDLVHREYDEPLTISAKGTEHFKGSVVLTVINKFTLPGFNCEMLEVDYISGGIFRKHVDYMKKTRTQVLIPSNCDGKALPPEILQKENDPRLNELPMTDKDLKKLEKNLKLALLKSDKFFNWNDSWQLEANRKRTSRKNSSMFHPKNGENGSPRKHSIRSWPIFPSQKARLKFQTWMTQNMNPSLQPLKCL
jgi:hypothetical protein